MSARTIGPPELWGGIECTVNRVRGHYHDQVVRSGHETRPEDLDRVAALGIRALRYPVLWERTAPDGPERADWRWADARLARLRDLGVRPIVGLVHHGSGPRHTHLLDPGFPFGLAAYARAVAERYPWVEAWTPVNEPLTTARFAALYGHWYPHARDDLSFLRATLNQCRATVLAMRAIREVIPHAQLVQTEDLGKIHSTPTLAYQARFENERRWLSFDLLTGRLAPSDRMRRYARSKGIPTAELERFRENACPPDVLGANHYLSSERFLDERLARYPRRLWGGNGRHRYADVEAARTRADGGAGPAALFWQLWTRYRRPIAVTEVHNGCTREEQLRWLVEVWDAACAVKDAGADLRAVTIWALLGSHDWDSLVTRQQGHYEPGAFDVRGPVPRPTAVAHAVTSLARGERPESPVVAAPGWWRRPLRLTYGGIADAPGRPEVLPRDEMPTRPLLVTGATGTLGQAMSRIAHRRGLACRVTRRDELDVTRADDVRRWLDTLEPWAVVNTAGYVRVDDAEADAERCLRENRDGAVTLAALCAERGVPLVTFSSDLVFDGRKGAAYVESDPVLPLNVYGRSKAEAEAGVLARHPRALVVRTAAFFGPWDRWNFVAQGLQAMERGDAWHCAEDLVVSPTYVPHLVDATLDLLIDGEAGLWHLSSRGEVSWADFARRVATFAGLDERLVAARPADALGLLAPRPAHAALDSERGRLLPPLERAILEFLDQRKVRREARARLEA